MVCLLQKSLCGLKQSPHQWYMYFDEFMINKGFKRYRFNHFVYLKQLEIDLFMYLLIYVDDMLVVSKGKAEVQKMKQKLKYGFEMKDFGPARKIPGIDILRDRKNSVLSYLCLKLVISRKLLSCLV